MFRVRDYVIRLKYLSLVPILLDDVENINKRLCNSNKLSVINLFISILKSMGVDLY